MAQLKVIVSALCKEQLSHTNTHTHTQHADIAWNFGSGTSYSEWRIYSDQSHMICSEGHLIHMNERLDVDVSFMQTLFIVSSFRYQSMHWLTFDRINMWLTVNIKWPNNERMQSITTTSNINKSAAHGNMCAYDMENMLLFHFKFYIRRWYGAMAAFLDESSCWVSVEGNDCRSHGVLFSNAFMFSNISANAVRFGKVLFIHRLPKSSCLESLIE